METSIERGSVVPTGCCPPFDPKLWDGKEVFWKDKPFLKTHVPCVLHVPIGMGKIVLRAMAQIEAARARPSQPLMLSEDATPFGIDLYIDVTGPVPDAKMASLSGTFLTRVFEGPYQDMGKWFGEMRAYAASKRRTVEKIFFGYTMCPACAKAYGKNYVIAFAKVGA